MIREEGQEETETSSAIRYHPIIRDKVHYQHEKEHFDDRKDNDDDDDERDEDNDSLDDLLLGDDDDQEFSYLRERRMAELKEQ